MHRLPPLNPLRAFEAAGRLNNIRRAADELSVTPGAISRQVRTLEEALGVQLFHREPRSVVLTAEGEQYLNEISKHLEGIRSATQKITGGKSFDIIRIQAYTTFAMKWLIPRLSSFHEQNKQIEVRLTASLANVDFDRENIDGAVRLGDGEWPGVISERLLDNVLLPVCSHSFKKSRSIKNLEDLRHQPLLHTLARPDDWNFWLTAAGLSDVPAYEGAKYASSALACQAALEGHGVAMAQEAIIADDLRSGRLVCPVSFKLDRKDFTYYFIYPPNRLRNPAFRCFKDWLKEEIIPKNNGGAFNRSRQHHH